MLKINCRSSWIGPVALLLLLTFPAIVFAGQGFYTLDKTIRTGMLVSLTQNPGVVESASDKNASKLLGVVGNTQTDFDVAKDQISIQTDGVVNTLVTNVSGDIKVGDRIGTSSIVGFGSKASSSGWVVGIAQGSLDAGTKDAVKSVVSDSSGMKHDVYVANITVLINVTYFNTRQQAETETVPSKLQTIADYIAGRRASKLAIVLGALLLIAGFIIAGVIVNAAVKNGISAIARQPLSKQEIVKGMIRSFAMAIAILAVASAGGLIIIRFL